MESEEMERAYTVREIDALRRVCEDRWLYGTSAMGVAGFRTSRSYRGEEKDVAVEQMVRTYMLGGVVASDIIAEDEERMKLRNPKPADYPPPA